MKPETDLTTLATRLSQALDWEAAVPNSANTAAHVDEIETAAVSAGYTLDQLYSQIKQTNFYTPKNIKACH